MSHDTTLIRLYVPNDMIYLTLWVMATETSPHSWQLLSCIFG